MIDCKLHAIYSVYSLVYQKEVKDRGADEPQHYYTSMLEYGEFILVRLNNLIG